MIDLIDGIRHKDAGSVAKKHMKSFVILTISALVSIQGVLYFIGSDKYLTVNAEIVGVMIAVWLLWLKGFLSDICDLSKIHCEGE